MSLGRGDEEKLQREPSQASDARLRPASHDLPRFTLRGLFVFLTAVAVCLSMGVTAERLGGIYGRLLAAFDVIVAWAVLLETYRRLGLGAALVCHLVVPFLFASFSLLPIAAGSLVHDALSETIRFASAVFLWTVSVGCLLGSLMSAAIAATTLIVAAVKTVRTRSH